MRVAIVGAGIAGLTLVHELNRRGITDIVVLEKAEQFTHIGAGIHIGSWGATILDANDTGALARPRGTAYRARRYLDRHGNTIGVVSHEDIARRHGGVTGFYLHRADLHEALDTNLQVRVLHNGVHLESIEHGPESVRVHTQEHGSHEVDLVVGCDGLHSQVRELTFHQAPHPIGKAAVRTIVDAAPTLTEFEVYRGIGTSVGLTPLNPSQAYLWFNFRVDSAIGQEIAEQGLPALVKHLGDYTAPHIQYVLERMDPGTPLLINELFEVSVEPWWERRVVLCGDAAHAMSPSTGSGGTMAIEDAFVLARELARVSAGTCDLDTALDAYYRQRLPRVEQMRIRTRMADYLNNLPTEELCRQRDERDRVMLADPDAHAFEVTDALDPNS